LGEITEACRKHSRVAINTIDYWAKDFIDKKMRELAVAFGFASKDAFMQYFENDPQAVMSDPRFSQVLGKALAGSSTILNMILAFAKDFLTGTILVYAKKRGGLKYEDVIDEIKGCGMEYTYKFMVKYPRISAVVLSYIEEMAKSLAKEQV